MRKINRIYISVFTFILIINIFIPLLGGAISVNAQTTDTEDLSGTITVAMHKDPTILDKYIKAFNEKYPNIEVKYTCLVDYENDINNKLSSGNVPDVFLVPGSISYDEYERYLEPLGSYDALVKKYSYMDKAIYKNGLVFGIPSFTYIMGFIYNKDIFTQAGISSTPKAIEEFLSDCALIKAHTKATPVYTNYSDDWALGYWETFPFIEMHGTSGYHFNEFLYEKEPFSEGKSHYQVYNMLYQIVANGYSENIGEGSYSEACEKLANGDIAMMALGSWAYKEITSSFENANLGFMAFPNTVNGRQYATVCADYCYGISSKSTNKSAAKAFVNFMLDESGYAIDNDNISILKSDPCSDLINSLEGVSLATEGKVEVGYELLNSLYAGVNPGNSSEIKRVIDSASGRTSESFDDIMDDWNKRWEASRPKNADEGENYQGSDEVDNSNSNVFISDKEAEYIENKKTLTVGYLDNFPPFSYTSSGGYSGLVFDVCAVIEENTGMKISYVAYSKQSTAVEDLKNGKVDMIACLPTSSDDSLKYSTQFFQALNVYAYRDGLDVTNLSEKRGIFEMSEVESMGSSADVVGAQSISDCFKKIESGKADYTITNYNTADYMIRELDCDNIVVFPSSSNASIKVAFSDDVDSSLLALVNKCILSINKDELEVSLLKYSSTTEKPVTFESLLKSNPTLFVIINLVVFGSIIGAISLILMVKTRSNKELSLAMKKYKILGALADEYMFDIDYEKKQITFDDKFMDNFNYPATITVTNYHPSDERCVDFVNKVYEVSEDDSSLKTPFELSLSNGEKQWFRIFISTINDQKGNIVHAVGKLSSVQNEMQEVQNYQTKASTDELTGIFNRRGFEDNIPATASEVAYIVTDLDNFKSVNDFLGHAGGDEVLKLMARSMKEYLGENAIIGRYGGDEFVAVIRNINQEDLTFLLSDFVSSMDMNYEYEGLVHKISVSVGAVYSKDYCKVVDLFNQADNTLYERKNKSKNGFLIKKAELND